LGLGLYTLPLYDLLYTCRSESRQDPHRRGDSCPRAIQQAPRTASRERFADFQQSVRMADGADTTPDDHNQRHDEPQ